MDILVLLAEFDGSVDPTGASGVPIAHVRSAPDPTVYDADFGRGAREIVTLYGAAEADHLAVAIAAACEGRRAGDLPPDAIRRLGVWADRGAVGDVAWRDRTTGRMTTRDVAISAAAIAGTAGRLLLEHGRAIRQTIAGLSMTDWPDDASRAIHVSLGRLDASYRPSRFAAVGAGDALLASLREADGYDDALDERTDTLTPR